MKDKFQFNIGDLLVSPDLEAVYYITNISNNKQYLHVKYHSVYTDDAHWNEAELLVQYVINCVSTKTFIHYAV